MRLVTATIASLLACVAFLASSTAAAAGAPAARAPQTPQRSATQAPSPWLMLSAMSSARSIALAGTAAAAQPNDPPRPPPPYAAAPVINGEVIGVLVWWALIALALTHRGSGGGPNSPP